MMSFIKKNYKSILLYLVLFLIIIGNLVTNYSLHGDNYYNYGSSLSIYNGLIPYRDYNIVVFPLSAYFIAFFLLFFGNKFLVYYAVYAAIDILIIHISRKINKLTTFLSLFLILHFNATGYSILSLFLILLTIYLVDNKKNDYLIGFVAGLLFMTKQVTATVAIPLLLFTKDINKSIKRFLTCLIPAEIIMLVMYSNNAFDEFINHTVFGLFDFGVSNGLYNPLFIGTVLIIGIIDIIKYLKTKDNLYIFAFSYLIMAYPIFDSAHTILGIFPSIILIIRQNNLKIKKKLDLYFIVLSILTIIFLTYNTYKDKYLVTDIKDPYFLVTVEKNMDDYNNVMNKYYKKYSKNYNVLFNDDSIYSFKIKYNIPINEYDLTYYGNNGYKGTDRLIKQLNESKDTVIIMVENVNTDNYDQTNQELKKYIRDNYKMIDRIKNNYAVYKVEKKN